MIKGNLFRFGLILAINLIFIECQPPGWRMIDRFYGFRYELFGENIISNDLAIAVQKQADNLGCFGWIQPSKKGTFVGEARCTKSQGPKFQSWLEKEIPNTIISNMEVHVYDDTKIRLHFAYFKIIEESRDTCFLNPPHQCSEFTTSSQQSNQGEFKKDEL